MASTMTSYDTGSKPFKPDISRGQWLSVNDFYTTSFAYFFGIKSFSLISMYAVSSCGFVFIFPFLFGLFIFGIPISFIQSFMGQFSSSGFISAYRIAPLFKGAGYTILIINLAAICYGVAVASYSLIYLLDSFSPDLPWMSCNSEWNTHNCTVEQLYDDNHTLVYQESWSSAEYFIYAVCLKSKEDEPHSVAVSWRLLICSIVIWILTTAIVLQGVEFIGKLLRYFCYIIIVCLSISFLRILFVEKGFHLIYEFFTPPIDRLRYFDYILFGILLPVCLYGTGGGPVLTIASYNSFHTNIYTYTWLNAMILLVTTVISGLWLNISEEYLNENFNFKPMHFDIDDMQILYIGVPFFFGNIGWSNLWSMIFFLMLFLGELSGCVIQLLAIMTAIFDEFELLRTFKKQITIFLSIALFLFTLGFTTNEGINLIQPLTYGSAITLCLLCFLDVMIVVWLYGRERFQRDVVFLLQCKMYKKWEFMILRFLTPALVLLLLLLNIAIYLSDLYYRRKALDILIITVIVKFAPIILIFAWICYKLRISTGSLLMRFKSLCKPNDWYPVDPTIKRRYEDVIGADSSENFQDLCTNIDLEDVDFDDD